jgi:hypothetical protein
MKVNRIQDLSNFPNLETLDVIINNLDEIDLTGLSNLTRLYLQQNNITSLDLSPCPNLTEVRFSDNPNLNVTGLPVSLTNCGYINGFDCLIDGTVIDDILILLAETTSVNGGFLNLSGTNGLASQTGIDAGNSLVNEKSWTVFYNYL